MSWQCLSNIFEVEWGWCRYLRVGLSQVMNTFIHFTGPVKLDKIKIYVTLGQILLPYSIPFVTPQPSMIWFSCVYFSFLIMKKLFQNPPLLPIPSSHVGVTWFCGQFCPEQFSQNYSVILLRITWIIWLNWRLVHPGLSPLDHFAVTY